MDTISSDDESDAEPISTEMLEDMRYGGQSHLIINRIEAQYKIRYHIKRIQEEWKGALLSTRNMVKVLHNLFKAVVNDILPVLPILV